MTIYPFLPQTLTFGSFSFYTYGLIIGLAIFTGLWLIDKKAQKEKIKEKLFYKSLAVSFLGGVIGARVWHVATDYWLYLDDWWSVFNLRGGGLSILGAILGGIGALLVFNWYQNRKKRDSLPFWLVLDLSVFGLPVAQAIGRVGNFANQELYGSPVLENFKLLKLYVEPAYRLATYKLFPLYHPLFLYEIIGLVAITGLVYWLDKKQVRFFRLGKGRLFLVYLVSYSFLRFFLEFLRLDKTMFPDSFIFLGVNQLIVGVVGVLALVALGYEYLKAKRKMV